MPIADLINNVFCERAVHSTGDEHSITLDEFKGSMKSKLGELLDPRVLLLAAEHCCWLPRTAAGCCCSLLLNPTSIRLLRAHRSTRRSLQIPRPRRYHTRVQPSSATRDLSDSTAQAQLPCCYIC